MSSDDAVLKYFNNKLKSLKVAQVQGCVGDGVCVMLCDDAVCDVVCDVVCNVVCDVV